MAKLGLRADQHEAGSSDNHSLTLGATRRDTRGTHDGVIVTLCSNTRWCSDQLEIHARNGEVVRVLFVIDACDREIIAW